MIIFSLIMVSGLFFYRILTPSVSVEELVVPSDGKSKKKMKFRFNGVNSNA
jgi:hypothetical protein